MKRIVRSVFFLWAFCWLGVAGAMPCRAQLVTIGILPFQDESGTHASPELLQRIVRDFKLKMTLAYKDVLGRQVSGEAWAAASAAGIEQLAALGKQQGVRFVIRGGLLAAISEKTGGDLKCRLELFCDIVDVDSLAVSSLRTEGEATESNSTRDDALRWDSYNWDSPDIVRTALGQALEAALRNLVDEVHAAAVAPRQQVTEEAAQNVPASATANPTIDPYQLDQDLQQLITQAESLISGGAASNLGDITPLQQSVEGLKASMDTKLSLLQQAQDTAAVDQEILQRKQALQGLVSDYTQRLAAAPYQPANGQELTGERKNLSSKLSNLLDSTLNALLKIQEIRAALGLSSGGGQGEAPPAEAGAGESWPAEEQTSDVSGVVTDEAGYPMEDATVSDPETGASATTDGTGSYTIANIPGGRMANLHVVKGGNQIAVGRIELQPGNTGIADWMVRSGSGGSTSSTSRVMPSSLIVKSSGSRSNTGTIQGVVRNDRGQPVPRALVSVKGIGVVRTDSGGRYTFANVPQGSYELVVQRPGSAAQNQRIAVTGLKTVQPQTLCKTENASPGQAPRAQILVQGENTLLKGRVVDAKDKPLSRAKVTVVHPGGALAAYSDSRGSYEIHDVKQGTYRVLASKAGYADASTSIHLEKNNTASWDFKLKDSSSAAVLQAVASQNKRQPTSMTPAHTSAGSSTGHKAPTIQKTKLAPVKQTEKTTARQTPTKTKTKMTTSSSQAQTAAVKGGVRGTIVDGKTGSAVSGATVVLKGKPNAQTDSAGQFNFGDLEPGTYSVSVKKSGYTSGSGSFTVKSGGVASLRVRLSPIVAAKPAPTAIRKR
jgi:protocatechuate 3,4-dioxygenase beta subunit